MGKGPALQLSQRIQCCRYCVAPKRHPGCHDTCKEYLEEKAINDTEKAERIKREKEERLLKGR